MNPTNRGPGFWIGNALLALSLVMLYFMGTLSEVLGAWAMALWMGCAGLGFYFVTRDKGHSSTLPD
jgi:hypothetical protein